MKDTNHIRLSPKVAHKISETLSRDAIDAYIMVKLLASHVKHPIILNYKAHINACRLLIGYSDRKYRHLINVAIRQGYARIEGDNLCLISRKKEKRFYKATKYIETTREKLKDTFHAALLHENIKRQRRALNKKASVQDSCQRNTGDAHNSALFTKDLHANYQITLSARSVARILLLPLTTAHRTLTHLNDAGLILLTKNRICISREQFRTLLIEKSYNVRFDKQNKEYYFLGASHASVPVKSVVSSHKGYTKTSFGYCDI